MGNAIDLVWLLVAPAAFVAMLVAPGCRRRP